MSRLARRYDVVVAGARAAGASTALLLARSGARVLLVDPTRRGTDTLSTHALMRGGVLQLARWGLLDRIKASGAPRIEQTTFHYGETSIDVPIKARGEVDGLYAPRRTVLDRVLVDAAEDAGVHVVHGAALRDVLLTDGRVSGAVLTHGGVAHRVASEWVVGADGVRSMVARAVRATKRVESAHRTATVYGYLPLDRRDAYDWHYGRDIAMGMIPTNAGESCVFAAVPPARFEAERTDGLDRIFADVLRSLSPETAAMAAELRPALRGFAGLHGFIRRSAGPGWALVGDAGYFKDPSTAHGITDALRDAELLARAIARGTDGAVLDYELVRDDLVRGLFDVTDRIASFDWTLEEAQELHLELSREMSHEVKASLEYFEPIAAVATT